MWSPKRASLTMSAPIPPPDAAEPDAFPTIFAAPAAPAAAAGGAGGGAAGGGATATSVAGPGFRLRTPTLVRRIWNAPLAIDTCAVDAVICAVPHMWVLVASSESNSRPYVSSNTPSAVAAAPLSSTMLIPLSHRSNGPVKRAPAPTMRSSLIPASSNEPPACVSAIAPASSVVSEKN